MAPRPKKTSTVQEIRDAALRGDTKVWKNGARVRLTAADRLYFLDHSERFRKVSNRYPRRVAEAYEGDLARAMADSDEQVDATVQRLGARASAPGAAPGRDRRP